MLSGMRGRGADARAALRAAGIPAEVLSDARLRVPIAGYAALYNEVVHRLGDEGFGLFAAPLRPGTFEFLCRGALASRDLAEALDRIARFLAIVLPDLEVSIARDGGRAQLRIAESRRLQRRRDDPRRVFAFEWLLRLVHGLACWLAARGIAFDEVAFPYARPAHAPDYALVYTESARFGGAALVATLDAAVLDWPVRRGEDELALFLEGAPGKISLLYRRDREITRAVREHLARSLRALPALDEVARSLGLSSRTLHRRLSGEGSSYRALLDGVRRQHAIERLERSDDSVARIASDLGYAEPSAFFRAFQAWTGRSPTGYRRTRRA
ncbi:MAG TPA: AraC family transcriptional regulator ligand-binding domain-containing protein [Usitatibacter sp.]|nr:AraC family transcriptional regulator ligand-binding domain-containing protein [Usitatibacter sp.]